MKAWHRWLRAAAIERVARTDQTIPLRPGESAPAPIDTQSELQSRSTAGRAESTNAVRATPRQGLWWRPGCTRRCPLQWRTAATTRIAARPVGTGQFHRLA